MNGKALPVVIVAALLAIAGYAVVHTGEYAPKQAVEQSSLDVVKSVSEFASQDSAGGTVYLVDLKYPASPESVRSILNDFDLRPVTPEELRSMGPELPPQARHHYGTVDESLGFVEYVDVGGYYSTHPQLVIVGSYHDRWGETTIFVTRKQTPK